MSRAASPLAPGSMVTHSELVRRSRHADVPFLGSHQTSLLFADRQETWLRDDDDDLWALLEARRTPPLVGDISFTPEGCMVMTRVAGSSVAGAVRSSSTGRVYMRMADGRLLTARSVR